VAAGDKRMLAATCGHLRPLEWLQVAASGCHFQNQITRLLRAQCIHMYIYIYRSTWLHAIRERWVLGFLGGPPCNTWSRARHVQQHGGPRVIRVVHDPWGLASLRLAELEQILMGNLLLGFALECMTLLALYDGAGALEHPREPEPAHMVSIWRLPIVQLLLLLPSMRLVTFTQGLLGAPSPKPTTMMVLGLSGLEDDLRAGRVSEDLPHGVSVGRDSSGQYRTAPLKEYPPSYVPSTSCCIC
jgi:hypothetical protein